MIICDLLEIKFKVELPGASGGRELSLSVAKGETELDEFEVVSIFSDDIELGVTAVNISGELSVL